MRTTTVTSRNSNVAIPKEDEHHCHVIANFVEDHGLTFSSKENNEHFNAQFNWFWNTVASRDDRERRRHELLEHLRLHLVRKTAKNKKKKDPLRDPVIGVEQARRRLSPHRPADGFTSLSQVDLAQFIGETTQQEHSNGAERVQVRPFNEQTFQLFQGLAKSLDVPENTIASLYVLWKDSCGALDCADVPLKQLEVAMTTYLYDHLERIPITNVDVPSTPTRVQQIGFHLLLVELRGLTFSSEKNKLDLLSDWAALTTSCPSYEGYDAIAEVFMSHLGSERNNSPQCSLESEQQQHSIEHATRSERRLSLRSAVWPYLNEETATAQQLYTFLTECYPMEAMTAKNPFLWFQREICDRRKLSICNTTMRVLYVLFRMKTTVLTTGEALMALDNFCSDLFDCPTTP